jgi:glutamine synthetase
VKDFTGVRFIHLTMVDNAGIVRLKMIPIDRLEHVAEFGVGISTVLGVFTIDDHVAYLPGRAGLEGPAGDMRLVPDLDAAVALGDGIAWAPVDQIHQDGTPNPTCQRSLLRRIQQDATAEGLAFRIAFEVEFTLLGDGVRTWPAFSAAGLLEVEDFATDLVDALEEQGLHVQQIQAEAGPGQFEVAIAAADPLTAADRHIVLRLTIRRIAARYGFDVSFAPAMAASEDLGNGCHIHWSAWRGEENIFAAGAPPFGLSDDGEAAAAGLLDRLHECCAVFAPSVCSYLRLQPSHWSGAYTTWGADNREAALRFSRGSWAHPGGANFEVKPADGAANPYLAAAVIVAAALDGLARGARLPAPIQADPATLTDEERSAAGVRRLPADLGEAIDAIAASQFAKETLGEEEHAAFVATRRNEWDTFRGYERSELVKFHELRYG